MKDVCQFLFLDHNLDDNAKKLVQLNGFELLAYSAISIQNESTQPKLLLIDDYSISPEQIAIFKSQNFTTVEINDLPWENKGADILINHTPGLTRAHFTTNENQTLYLGSDYLLLRPEFFIQSAEKTKKIKNQILVMMGGTDPYRIMRNIANSAFEFEHGYTFIFIQGSENEDTAFFQTLSATSSACKLFINLSAKELSDLMLESEYAIVTSSTSALEAIMSGCLVVTGTIAENQILLNSQLDKMELAVNIGELNKANWKKVFAMLAKNDFTKIKNHTTALRSNVDTSKLSGVFIR